MNKTEKVAMTESFLLPVKKKELRRDLEKEKKGTAIQRLKCCTSNDTQIQKGQNAESTADFIPKFLIEAK